MRSAGAASQIACARLNAVCSRTPPSADVGRTYLPGPLEQPLRVGRPPLGQRHLAQAGHRIGEERVIAAEHTLEGVEHRVHVGARFGAAAEREQGLPAHQTRGADLV